MATRIGSISIGFAARIAPFMQGTRKVKKGLAGVQQKASSTMGVLRKLTPVLGVAGVGGGFGYLTAQALGSIDALAKTSDKLGIATDQLAALRFAAEQTGVQSNTLDMALQRMTRRLSEAAQGSGEAVGAIEELGLSAAELAAMSPDQAFRRIARAMQDVEGQSNKVRLAFKLFDSEGVSLVNTLALGEEGLAKMAAQASAAGLAVSRFDASRVEQANDAVNLMRQSFSGLVNLLAIDLAPTIKTIADMVSELTQSSVSGASRTSAALGPVSTTIGLIGDGLEALKWAGAQIMQFIFSAWKPTSWLMEKTEQFIVYLLNKIPGVRAEMSGLTTWIRNYANESADYYGDMIDRMEQAESFSERLRRTHREMAREAEKAAAAQKRQRESDPTIAPGAMGPGGAGAAGGPMGTGGPTFGPSRFDPVFSGPATITETVGRRQAMRDQRVGEFARVDSLRLLRVGGPQAAAQKPAGEQTQKRIEKKLDDVTDLLGKGLGVYLEIR